MATAQSIEKFRIAAKSYINDDTFSDFTIECEGKEWKVHRCFISPHSPFFKQCCSGMFEETSNRRVELKEDLKEVVDCMINFFYTFDYDDTVNTDPLPHLKSGRPRTSIQMNAHVYSLADKYQVEGLKALAFEKFKKEAEASTGIPVLTLAATWTVMKDLILLETRLQNVLLNMWILGMPDMFTSEKSGILHSFIEEMPEWIWMVMKRVMSDLKGGTAKVSCKICHRQETIPRSRLLTNEFRCKGCHCTEIESDIRLQGTMRMDKFW